ncbi:MAG TPA: pyridoxamine 5'-phosphate oxidase family protein [Thermomonospora sp.]|nr:pyridoxamine 5'-phosphate oxidase family protein [Thermomonospora sp.]
MSGKRDTIRMSPEEVAAFLAEEFKVQVATLDPDGAPHLVTMFYALLDGKIAFTTYAASQKVVNLRRNPTMTCLVEAGTEYAELRGVKLKGTGRIIEDPAVRTRVGAVVGSRLAGLPAPAPDEPLDAGFAEALERSLAKRVVIVMEPEHVASWDHRKG